MSEDRWEEDFLSGTSDRPKSRKGEFIPIEELSEKHLHPDYPRPKTPEELIEEREELEKERKFLHESEEEKDEQENNLDQQNEERFGGQFSGEQIGSRKVVKMDHGFIKDASAKRNLGKKPKYKN